MARVARVSVINTSIVFLCMIGFVLSCYAYVVEMRKEQDHNYEPMCDLSEHISCTKAFDSPYGRGFGIGRHIFGENSPLNQPNSIAGMIFYCLLGSLCLSNNLSVAKWQVYLSVLSNIGSIYLAYILVFILYDFCVICVSAYFVNFFNLLLAIVKLRRINKIQPGTSARKDK